MLLLAACKSSSPAASSATPPDAQTHGDPTASEDAPEVSVPATWEEAEAADLDAQIAYMKTKVVPAMKPKFKEADPDEFAGFSCATCHGPDKKDPQEFLPHLTMADGQIAEFATMPDVSKYMAESIVPAMAEAMGEAPFDPATGQGFGCAGCHTIDPE